MVRLIPIRSLSNVHDSLRVTRFITFHLLINLRNDRKVAVGTNDQLDPEGMIERCDRMICLRCVTGIISGSFCDIVVIAN